ncbi:hypothetical protein HY623_03675 [Candidatus Uhrbacteria bacterium]|nr:hypothetical protein [Candidatus Uhrbacteria bacterium]
MNKKILGITLGAILLIAGIALIIVGVQEIMSAKQGASLVPKNDLAAAVNESQKELVSYEHPATKMKMSYPKNWTLTNDEEGGGVSFSFYGGAVNLRFVSDDFSKNKDPVTLDEYTQVLMAQGREEAAKQQVTISPISDGPATLAGSPGHEWQYTVTIGDVEGSGMQVWTIKNNRSYVFTYTAAGELFNAFTPVVQKMFTSIALP